MSEEKKFEVWALLELFGHTRIAGKVTEQTIAGQGFMRVEVPTTSRQAAHTEFYTPSAIFRMVPVSEDVATALAEEIWSPQIVPVSVSTQRLIAQEVQDDPPF